ncbi:MAG: peptidoglycan DD-metalloendopeptidase family protein [Cyanobacteria bacterium J06621_12]
MFEKKAVFPPTSKTNFTVAHLTHNAYFQQSIFLSLVLVTQLVGWNKPVQALEQNSSNNKQLAKIKQGSNFQPRQQNQVSLPKIINLIAFSLKSQPVKSAPVSQEERSPSLASVNPTVEPLEIHLADSGHSSHTAKSPLQIHQVQKGDTLSKIARKYQVSVTELVKLNQISNSNIIYLNQRLQIPTPLARGGASDSDIAAVSEIANSNSSQSDTSNIANPEEDFYITQLRAEIDQLRAEYGQKHQKENNPGLNSSISFATNDSKPPESLVTANLAPAPQNNVDTDQESLIAALTLPSLTDEQYLPDAFDGYIWPTQGVLTSHYGWRWGRIHRGIDIAAPIGTPIVAAAAGEVIGAGWYGGYGNLVKLEHLDGSITYYAHNHRNLVTHGQRVKQGEQIAEMGSTGNSTGSHLHFEIHLRNKEVIDPLVLLDSK